MRILILSMTVGQGHNSASKAIMDALISKGHACEMLDTYKFLNRAIGEVFDKGYTLMGRMWPKLNENIYTVAEHYNGKSDMKMYFPWMFADLNKEKMQAYIDEYKPDVIICSIVMAAMLITALKDSLMLKNDIKTFGIITDFSLHPFWEYTDMDYFVCPSELMIPSMCKRGIPKYKILPFGIPVSDKFSKSIPKEEARRQLGLEKDIFTVMLSAGGMGFAGLISAIKDIDCLSNVQMIAVCGTNKKLFNHLNSMEFNNKVKVLEYIKNMDEYLDACDIFVTKPGGLSTSEAIAKIKPMILTNPMPGVENMNLAFLINNSLALHANQYQPLSEVILQMQINYFKMDEIKAAQKKWGKRGSATHLENFIESIIKKEN